MARKLFIFLTGAIFLSAAWIGVVSSIETNQKSLKAEGAPIILDLMQSRWQRLAGFKAIEADKLKKPAKFVYNFSGLDMVLVDSITSKELSPDLYLDVKTTALDAGKKSSFYTFEASSGEQFLVRSLRVGEDLKITGFDLDAALNFFGQGLEDTEWFILDSKKRVLAAGERAYVGKTKAAGSDYNSFKYTLAGKRYEFLTFKEKDASLGMANFMGVIGILFVMTGLFFYTDGQTGNTQASVQASHELFKDEHAHVPEIPEEALTLGLSEEIIEDDIPEDVQMVDLSNTKKPFEPSLDYTGFLIENPILAKAPKNIEEKIEVTAAVVIEEEEEEIVHTVPDAVTSDEWVRLAEELSANIDKFTETAGQAKSTRSSKADA